ncbi:TIGR02680 family protein [Paenibacillus odorifer]|uniref:TIGR02680 family protein n=1 Tax=Paenibacillus odorifer TaxID=189426 RepID=A0A1R0Y1B3_9BACL|nr:TIGR02680 family protein [Paenibacillus odorifer]OMD41130.1 TIGR02680 family protein [Paenibacillus odorifer]
MIIFKKETNRWKPHRLILCNYWYYPYKVYQFKNGRILFRGHNASGKSITMQSLFTFLLDGNKSPSRLDPFGSSARKLYEILLGEESVNRDIQERIGYIAIEYKREKTEEYMTTGFGLHSKRKDNRLKNAWGFVIHDPSRRINEGENPLPVYKREKLDGKWERLPLTREEFVKAVGNSGTVVDESHYAALVNSHLFKFPDVSNLEMFTEVLTQLKSPKLSREAGPNKLKEVLHNSLMPISDKEISPLTVTVESMDKTQATIEKHEQDLAAVRSMATEYAKYKRYVFAEKAKYYLDNKRILDSHAKKFKETENTIRLKSAEKETKEAEKESKSNELEVLNREYDEYRGGEVAQLQGNLDKAERELTQFSKDALAKEERFNTKNDLVTKSIEKIRKLEDAIYTAKKEMGAHLAELEDMSEDTGFDNVQYLPHFKKCADDAAYDFSMWEQDSKKYLSLLQTTRSKIKEYESLKDKTNALKIEIERLQIRYNEERELLKELADTYDWEREEGAKELSVWFESLRTLTASNGAIQETLDLFPEYLISVSDEQLKCPLSIEKDAQVEHAQMESIKLQNLMDSLKLRKGELEATLSDLENNKEIEPYISDAKAEQFKGLTEMGVPFIPFWAAVEFKEGLSGEAKANIESVAIELDLLNAAIVPVHAYDEAKTNSVVLSRNNKCDRNLTEYLTPVSSDNVSDTDILAVLMGISIDHTSQTFVAASGEFKTGIVEGTSPSFGDAKFIGKTARDLLRKKEIVRIQGEIATIEDELELLHSQKKAWLETKQQIANEFSSFPFFNALKTAKSRYEEKMNFITHIVKSELDNKSELYKRLAAELEGLLLSVKAMAAFTSLPLTEKAFAEAIDATNHYLLLLTNIKSDFRALADKRNSLRTEQDNKDEHENDLEDLRGELFTIRNKIDRTSKYIQSLEDQLKLSGAEEVRKRIAEVIAKLQSLPGEISQLATDVGGIQNKIENLVESLPSLTSTIHFYNELCSAWEVIFVQDVRENASEYELDEMLDTKMMGKQIYDKFGALLDKKEKSQVNTELSKHFTASSMSLIEYDAELKAVPYTVNFTNIPEEEQANVELLKSVAQFSKITLQLQIDGELRTLSPSELRTKLEGYVNMQKKTLTDKDRELFEDIMINSIGETIRNKIRSANDWVNRINAFMELAKNSSGLRFQVQWKPITKQEEGELKTEDLVKLLERDPKLLADHDRLSISQHFRSKVNAAKQIMEADGKVQFLEVIKSVLDYRKWYEIIIKYEKPGESMKEMQTKHFNSFSGGEKALAMYTPLLAAVDARLQSAGEDAPRIFALDEAFAGVDDNNIEETFKIIEMFDFDYTLNSQALWGCFSEVKHLSIYDLSRPQNANYVITTQYEWDGIRKISIAESLDDIMPEDTFEVVDEQAVLF